MKNQIEDSEKLQNILSDDDKSTIQDCLIDSQDWFDKIQNAEKEDYEKEPKELEKFINPIIMRAQQKYESNLKAKSYLESYILSVKNEIGLSKNQILQNLENLAKELKEAVKSSQDQFDENLNAEKKVYEEELKELKNCNPYYQQNLLIETEGKIIIGPDKK